MIDFATVLRRGIAQQLLALAVLTPWSVLAEEPCEDPGVVFGFFNGVQTTEDQAKEALRRHLSPIYGPTTPAGHPITYDLFYNDTEGLADFAETFDQRLREYDAVLTERFELFFAVVRGDRDGWWGALIQAVPAAGALFSDLLETVMAKAMQQLTRSLGDPSLAAVSQRHREQIDRWAAQDRKLLLFAHSQGNLFVNAAYSHALSKTDAASVRVVHVAPASPTLSGRHTLADKDFVINGLRATGLVAPNTDIIIGYATRSAGVNGRRDPLGHGLQEIYLNGKLSTSTRLATDVQHALAELDAAPRKPWAPYPGFVEPAGRPGDAPSIIPGQDDFSHSIVATQEISYPFPYVKGARGWDVARSLWQPPVTGWRTTQYTGKSVSGYSRCDWGEAVPDGWIATKFQYEECSFDSVPDVEAAEKFVTLYEPDELQAMWSAPEGTVVWLQKLTYTYRPANKLYSGQLVEGTMRFFSGREQRWTEQLEIEREWTEPYWRKGGWPLNQDDLDAWVAAYRAYEALWIAERERYWQGYQEYESRRELCER